MAKERVAMLLTGYALFLFERVAVPPPMHAADWASEKDALLRMYAKQWIDHHPALASVLLDEMLRS